MDLERRSLGEEVSAMMMWPSEEAWSWVFQPLKVTGPRETTVVSMAEGLSNRRVDPRKEARVAEPSLRIFAVGEAWIASMSVRPAGLGRVQWPQWGCLEFVSPPMT